jgi:hypothetical protein
MVILLHGDVSKSSINDLARKFEYRGEFMEFNNQVIFENMDWGENDFRKECHHLYEQGFPTCEKIIPVTTVENRYFGIKGGTKLTLVVIVSFFDQLPTLAPINTSYKYKYAFKKLKADNTITRVLNKNINIPVFLEKWMLKGLKKGLKSIGEVGKVVTGAGKKLIRAGKCKVKKARFKWKVKYYLGLKWLGEKAAKNKWTEDIIKRYLFQNLGLVRVLSFLPLYQEYFNVCDFHTGNERLLYSILQRYEQMIEADIRPLLEEDILVILRILKNYSPDISIPVFGDELIDGECKDEFVDAIISVLKEGAKHIFSPITKELREEVVDLFTDLNEKILQIQLSRMGRCGGGFRRRRLLSGMSGSSSCGC